MKIGFPERGRSGRSILLVKNWEFDFEDNVLFMNANLTIERGEKIAIIGPNRCGKNTLLKLIMVLETIEEVAEDWRIDDIRGLLGHCNFKSDMLDHKVSLLSGSEKVFLNGIFDHYFNACHSRCTNQDFLDLFKFQDKLYAQSRSVFSTFNPWSSLFLFGPPSFYSEGEERLPAAMVVREEVDGDYKKSEGGRSLEIEHDERREKA
ncbi:hypothetical protein K1719_037580 [Acacia pycnantha]|nr:hypothetical protein K1719_037580 [Acacia pycnantha]